MEKRQIFLLFLSLLVMKLLSGKKAEQIHLIVENMEAVARRGVPSWLELDKDNFKAKVKALPNRDELTMPIQEHLIVELYSK